MEDSDNQSIKKIPGGAYLVFNAQLFPISKSITKIGRKLDNDLVLQDTTISRNHAEIHFSENQFILKDLGSSGGTFLNNRKISEGILFSGDIILLARIPVMFMFEGASLKSQSQITTGPLHLDDLNSLDEVKKSLSPEDEPENN